MRVVVLAIVAAFVLPVAASQFQPVDPPDLTGITHREDLTGARDLEGAQRILRFVQVSDAHIIDDDAPTPMRVGLIDPLGPPVEGAGRPHEEYSDEYLDAMIGAINAVHAEDALDFVISTGDNIDNQLENELMRFIDNWEGTYTTVGPVSGRACQPDGQSAGVDDDSQDVTMACTSLPPAVADNNTRLAPDLPWYSAFGNHDGLIQGNVPIEPSFREIGEQFGRYFIHQREYVGMHFDAGAQCAGTQPAGVAGDDFGHGYGFAGERLCDEDPDNDGYYSFDLRGVRVIVLDTVNDDFVTGNENLAGLFPPTETTLGRDTVGGYAEGSVDPVQFAWLLSEIDANPDQLVLIFSHHTMNSMFTDQEEACGPPGCLEDLLREAGYKTSIDLIDELSSRPNVMAWIGGHTHQHRIQPKATGAGGFWNVETSAIIDMPQQARAIELWQTAAGAAFLRIVEVDHTDTDLQAVAESDSQHDFDTASGTDMDRSVALWFDVPADVQLIPQPELPRDLNLFVDSNATAVPGEPYRLVVRAFDPLIERGVPGLQVTLDVGHPDHQGGGFASVITAGTAMTDVGAGLYEIDFTPAAAATHFATVTASDASGLYPERTQVFSIGVQGALDEEEGSPALGAAVLVTALAAVVVLVRRQNR